MRYRAMRRYDLIPFVEAHREVPFTKVMETVDLMIAVAGGERFCEEAIVVSIEEDVEDILNGSSAMSFQGRLDVREGFAFAYKKYKNTPHIVASFSLLTSMGMCTFVVTSEAALRWFNAELRRAEVDDWFDLTDLHPVERCVLHA